MVAIVVVHEPAPWFDETIASLASQDYPNLRFLFLVGGTADASPTPQPVDGNDTADGGDAAPAVPAPTVAELIAARLPDAFVREFDGDLGFGATANEVLRLVEGDKGLFLFCHDDVVPDSDAVRLLVEEIFRSNAGAVGPKIVDWDHPGVLQSVGIAVDRFGEVDLGLEPGELDQEQHDGVRDVFAVPTSFLLTRADLFRELGGFYGQLDFEGEDIEFCWRLHHMGARVVVVPSARVRHRSGLSERRPDLNTTVLNARHRMRTVTTLTAASRLPGRTLELVLLTLAELVVGVFTGKFSEAWASLRGLVGLIPRTPSILARRRVVKPMRQVPERELLGLQVKGSARLTGYLRARETATFVGAESSVRRWRQSTTTPVIAWIAVTVAILFGSRRFIADGVPVVGEFLAMPSSPRDLLSSYLSGWNSNGLGSTSPNPTGWATLSGLSFFTLFRMGALGTWLIVGSVFVGLVGVWKLATVFPSTRARIAALVVYAASPLVVGAMSTGQFNALVAYASVPWMVHSLRRAVGVETADPRTAVNDVADGLVHLAWPERLRRTAVAVLVVALAVAFTPVLAVVAIGVVVVLALSTLLAMAPWRTAALYLGLGLASVAGGVLLNFPWWSSWSWSQLVGPPPIGDPGRGVLDLASFQIGASDFASLSLALYLPVVAAIALAQAWRLTWAVRAGSLVVVFGALAVFGDRGALPFDAPAAGVLLAPVAVGLAISAAAALAAFDLDVRGGSFGWRQPLGIMASVGVVVGVFPGVAAIGDGAWGTPTTPLARLVNAQLPHDTLDRIIVDSDGNELGIDPGKGGYNVLFVGDARLLPVPAVEYRNGVSYAVVGDQTLDFKQRWASPTSPASETIVTALDQMANSSTLRAGQTLAPLGIRFIVAPEFDNVVSTTTNPLPLPSGLVPSLEDQLDLTSVTGLPTLEVFENSAWIPRVSQLTGATAEASRTAGAEALVGADLSSVQTVFLGAGADQAATDDVDVGVVHLAVPFDENWTLTVDGESIEPRRAFGITTAFDVETAGTGVLEYKSPSTRSLLVFLQVALWLAVMFAATRVSLSLGGRQGGGISDETLIDLDELSDFENFDEFADAIPALPVADPGLDMTGQIARAELVDDHTEDHAEDHADDVPQVADVTDVEVLELEPMEVEDVVSDDGDSR